MDKTRFIEVSSVLVPSLWAGLTIGISFMATPVKFRAKTLKRTAALDVGRHTFSLFNKAEWLLFSAMVALSFAETSTISETWPTVGLGLIVITQSFWLLPALVSRIEAEIGGKPKPASYHHTAYVALEATKLLITSYAAISTLFAVTNPDCSAVSLSDIPTPRM